MPMTLGEVIDRLKREDPDRVVRHGFGRATSYRMSYDEIGFEPADHVTIGSMLANAEAATDQDGLQSWKSGRYVMDLKTPCHIAVYGDPGDELTFDRLEKLIGNDAATKLRDSVEVLLDQIKDSSVVVVGGVTYAKVSQLASYTDVRRAIREYDDLHGNGNV